LTLFKTIIITYAVATLISCSRENNYLNDRKISNEEGIPVDSLQHYLPDSTFENSFAFDKGTAANLQNWFSAALYNMQEPLLYNFFLGFESYRFDWIRSFHRPVVISINKKDSRIWLSTRRLNRRPSFVGWRVDQGLPLYLDYDQTTELSIKDWNYFKQLLQTAKFWKISNTDLELDADGSMWIIEEHVKDHYRFVIRDDNNHSFGDIGKYLIRLSNLQEEIY
jgi:hypothetical protein